MDKLKMKSKDLTNENIGKIEELFPNVITEIEDESGNITKAIDFELLQQELSDEIVEGSKERYQLTWPGKKEAIVMGNTPIDKTLRPVKEDSLNWEDTENLYIEGDNLEVLKLLQESYLGKIKCIYIDPPYNTGNDFIYRDNFAQDRDEYAEESGQVDEEGNRLFQNTEYNGRYHSDWLTMMYPRLKLARNLLSDDGVIFISIDDHEVHNLRKICDEIFGERNFVADLIWTNKEGGGSSDSKLFRIKHEHIICYAKQIENVNIIGVPVNNEERYKLQDEYVKTRGKYYLQKLGMGSIQYSTSLDYPIEAPDGTMVMPADNNNGKKACWRWSKSKYNWGKENGFIEIKKDSKGVWTVYTKQYLSCDNEGNIIIRTQRPMGIIDEYSSTQASKLLEILDLSSTFNYSKPVELMQYLISRSSLHDEFILDFFSGSATTAHAVMDLNAEDGGNRKYIMVQLPELTDEKSEAYKAGYENICEIGKERIRRAGKKIEEETGADIDYGFRVYKVDSTNMKDVYYLPEELDQNLIEQLESNIKEDRTSLDLLTQVMLETGLELSLPMETREIRGKEVHFVAGNSLVACFDEDVDEELIKEIAKIEPLKAVFTDNSFSSCPDKINLEEIFKGLSPNTDIRVL